MSVLIAKPPSKATAPVVALAVNLSVFTSKFPVELKSVFVVKEPSTVIALAASDIIESAITLSDDHFVIYVGVPVPSTWL